MQCPRCQQDNPLPDAQFCPRCGAQVGRVEESGPPAASYADLRRDLTEALEQQTATSEILRVISSSATDVQPVLDAIAHQAMRLCSASYGVVTRYDGELLHLAAHAHVRPEGVEAMKRLFPTLPSRATTSSRAVLERGVVHVPDALADPDYDKSVARGLQNRSVLAVPMLRRGEPIGTISVGRFEPQPFTDTQIALLQTFADQAVIAIENVRLFTELQEKNKALTQAHEQVTGALARQTATSEILGVISRSQTDVQPVFDAIVGSAKRLLGGFSSALYRVAGDDIHLAPYTSTNPAGDAALRAAFPRPLAAFSPGAEAIRRQAPLVLIDIETAGWIPDEIRKLVRDRGIRSAVWVPMMREGMGLGAIGVARTESGGFAEEQIALLETFADQAIIAIENVRLFKELQTRTQELTRSVDQLTALGEVGRALGSTLNLEIVLTTIVSRAVQLSGLDDGVVFEYDEATEEFVQRVATESAAPLAEARRATRIRKGEGVVGRTANTLELAQVPDITLSGAYEGRLREMLISAGVRAVLAVPMLREGHLIGCLAVTRNTPGDFPAETMELLRTFATQSALAIQNARLFREIEIKSRQLEVASQHKSEFLANMSHELRTPLNAIIGFSEVLSERMFGELNEKQEEYSKDIHASGQHLLSLINDILDLSKIEAGRMELELTDFHLPTALDSALTLVRERAGRRGIALQMNVDNRLGQIQADERKVRQVVLNLLSNAIKFTPEGGRIEVAASPRDGSVEVSVSDTGVGIAPGEQEAVFEEFRQVGTADKKAEGTGLGLTLCRKFIELHGGKIWVKSQPGAGSTFTFTIPLRQGE
jgi:signal transduction histidine kinase